MTLSGLNLTGRLSGNDTFCQNLNGTYTLRWAPDSNAYICSGAPTGPDGCAWMTDFIGGTSIVFALRIDLVAGVYSYSIYKVICGAAATEWYSGASSNCGGATCSPLGNPGPPGELTCIGVTGHIADYGTCVIS